MDAGGGQFGRVTDKPVLELGRIGFRVKLQRQSPSEGEALVGIMPGGGQDP